MTLEEIVDNAKGKLRGLYLKLKSENKIIEKPNATGLDVLEGYTVSTDGDERTIYIVPEEVKDNYFDRIGFEGRYIVGEKEVPVDENIMARIYILYDMSNNKFSDSVDYEVQSNVNIKLLNQIDPRFKNLKEYTLFSRKEELGTVNGMPIEGHYIIISPSEKNKYNVEKIKEIRDRLHEYQ